MRNLDGFDCNRWRIPAMEKGSMDKEFENKPEDSRPSKKRRLLCEIGLGFLILIAGIALFLLICDRIEPLGVWLIDKHRRATILIGGCLVVPALASLGVLLGGKLTKGKGKPHSTFFLSVISSVICFIISIILIELYEWMVPDGFGIILILLSTHNYVISAIGFVIVGTGMGPVYPAIQHMAPTNFGKRYSAAVIGLQMASAYVGSTFMPMLFGIMQQYIGIRIMPFYLMFFAILNIGMLEIAYRVVDKKLSEDL